MELKKVIRLFAPHFVAVSIFLVLSIVYFYPALEGKVMHTNDGTVFKNSSREISDFRKEWADLFNIDSEVIFHCFSHQHLVSWVTRSRSSYIRSWGSYLNTRYGF